MQRRLLQIGIAAAGLIGVVPGLTGVHVASRARRSALS